MALQRQFAKSSPSFCNLGEKLNCDIVNRSEYSTIVGIPVALIGVAGYTALLLLSTAWRSRKETPNWLLGAALAGLGFALYLSYIEAHVLTTWCILCVISLVLIFLISALALIVRVRSARG